MDHNERSLHLFGSIIGWARDILFPSNALIVVGRSQLAKPSTGVMTIMLGQQLHETYRRTRKNSMGGLIIVVVEVVVAVAAK